MLALAFGAGALVGSWSAFAAHDPYDRLDTFARVLGMVEHAYVDPVPLDRLIDGALRGMVESLDAHSRWLDEAAYREMLSDTEGRYVGIGIEIRPVPDGALVVRVLPGGPAIRDGLLAGDTILAVDDAPLAGTPLSAISRILRGERGSALRLSVRRPGLDEPIEIATIRDRIDLVPVSAAMVDGDIAYVRLIAFQEGASREVERAIQRLRRDGATAVILDLRDNPGGLLDEAVRVADLFLVAGPIVTTRGRIEGEEIRSASARGFGLDLPLVVLVNQGSASASEVVAGALQDTQRAAVVGERTYGKGTVQSLMPVRGGGALKLTVARYYTPSGAPVTTEEGRSPDVVVPMPPDALIPWDLAPQERSDDDPQLRAAVDVLRER